MLQNAGIVNVRLKVLELVWAFGCCSLGRARLQHASTAAPAEVHLGFGFYSLPSYSQDVDSNKLITNVSRMEPCLRRSSHDIPYPQPYSSCGLDLEIGKHASRDTSPGDAR